LFVLGSLYIALIFIKDNNFFLVIWGLRIILYYTIATPKRKSDFFCDTKYFFKFFFRKFLAFSVAVQRTPTNRVSSKLCALCRLSFGVSCCLFGGLPSLVSQNYFKEIKETFPLSLSEITKDKTNNKINYIFFQS
tara:strand:+ start:285 stop:689 length:405 start_codon:yes stop_codon:yes gene_type:complete